MIRVDRILYNGLFFIFTVVGLYGCDGFRRVKPLQDRIILLRGYTVPLLHGRKAF